MISCTSGQQPPCCCFSSNACAFAAESAAPGDTIRQWGTADNPTGLPEAVEPQLGAAERVFMPAVLQGE